MKYKVFLLVILGAFVLWTTPKLAEARKNVTVEWCLLSSGEIFQDVATGKWLCCTDPDDKNEDGDFECDNEVLGGAEGGITVPLMEQPPKKKGPNVLKPRPLTEQPPEKKDPRVLTPRPLTEQPEKGTTRQPAQKVR